MTMPNAWECISFGDLYLVPSKNGLMAPRRIRGEGVPLVNMREIFAFDVIGSQEMELARLPQFNRESWLLDEGDLLFARQSLTLEGAGKCCFVAADPRMRTFESHIIRVRLNAEMAESRYYFYLFRSHIGRELIASIVEQVAAAGIRASDLARLEVPFPPLEKQRRIAGVLGALDDLIDTNRRLTLDLEGILAEQFSLARFDQPSDDGNRLSEFITINPTYARPKRDAPYVDMAALPTDRARLAAISRREPRGGARFMNGDTLMARITPCLENGKTGFIDQLEPAEVGVGSTEFVVLRSSGTLGPHWSYFLARSPRFREYAVQHMSGTSGRQRCPAEAIERYSIATPDLVATSAFARLAEPLFEAIKELDEEAQEATRARDELLPLLISGRVRVDEVVA
jgi:type I restriction enzyme S subunit